MIESSSTVRSVSLGRSGLKTSAAVMGTMTFGGDADEPESRRIFDFCLDRGIYAFDCANIYNGGRAEELLGRFAKGRRNDLIIATKAYFSLGKSPNDRGASRRNILLSVEASLKRLQTDWIDLFFVHRFDDACPPEETMSALDRLVQRGSVLYVGLSNFAAWQAQKMHDLARGCAVGAIACIQPMYNLVKRQCEAEILPMALSEGLGVLTYSPLAAGLLTGKFGAGGAPAAESRLAVNPMYQRRYDNKDLQGKLDAYLALCSGAGFDPIHLAIAWVAENKAVTAPILGARSLTQLEAQLPFMAVRIPPDVRDELDRIFAPPPPATDRSEEPRVNWARGPQADA